MVVLEAGIELARYLEPVPFPPIFKNIFINQYSCPVIF